MAPPPGAIPPTLPPSVEEAYRRKCIYLKRRLNDVEEANDASRLRLSRMQRGIEKMRLERAFLLEQLAKRTSTNVEDSEGSPSPPPTPKEKPLRTKRGHRKPDFLNDGRAGSSAFIQQGPATLSPSSDAFSHTHAEANAGIPANALRPVHMPPWNPLGSQGGTLLSSGMSDSPPFSRPKNAFDIYCLEKRSIFNRENIQSIQDGTYNLERALSEGWRNEPDKPSYEVRFLAQKHAAEVNGSAAPPARDLASIGGFTEVQNGPPPRRNDEDVEMGDDGEEASHSGADAGGSSFTAVNKA